MIKTDLKENEESSQSDEGDKFAQSRKNISKIP